MDGLTKFVLVLFILIGWGVLNSKVSSGESNKIQVLLDEATKQAAKRGVFQLSDEIVPIESKDCEGTQWIKQQDCSLNGASMDGTEDSCGPGKEIWILDPEHPDFKPATGDGKCKPQERDCEVKCPKPCEGDTWKDSGKCVRKEYTTKGNVIETVLDGTEGKCGEGITELNLDTTASDYKPAVGKGTCPMTKGGYCNVPCPKPEPPKCNSYTGWVENVGLGCVVTGTTKVKCGEKGMKQFYNITTNPKDCQDLVEWRECIGDPCPIDCEGSWSKWSDPKSDEPCGVQPYVESTFNVTTVAQYGGKACEYPDGDKKTKNSGTPKECCIENNDWALKPGTCGADGVAVYTQTYKENKVGGCPDEVKSKKMACCYQKGDWTDTSKCNSVGRKSQKQTTAGNCPSSVKTRRTDCKYISEWTKDGKLMKGTDKDLGGTMRLGSYEARLKKDTKISKIYNTEKINERHRHRYEVNINYKKDFENRGMIFSGLSPDNKLPEIIELENHPWFIGVQFHPEFKSRPLSPHPLFSSFIKAAKINTRK